MAYALAGAIPAGLAVIVLYNVNGGSIRLVGDIGLCLLFMHTFVIKICLPVYWARQPQVSVCAPCCQAAMCEHRSRRRHLATLSHGETPFMPSYWRKPLPWVYCKDPRARVPTSECSCFLKLDKLLPFRFRAAARLPCPVTIHSLAQYLNRLVPPPPP